MNIHIEKFFKDVETRLPLEDLLKGKTLVDAGIVKSVSTLARWRKHNYGPSFLLISSGQIRYVRGAVLEWLKQTQPPLSSITIPTQDKRESAEVSQ